MSWPGRSARAELQTGPQLARTDHVKDVVKRALVTVGTCAALLTVAGAGARAHTASKPPRVKVSSRCVHSSNAGKRSDTATATMRPVSGTQKLEIKFLLQDKAIGSGPFQTMTITGLGVWQSPSDPASLGQNPNDVWHVKQPVADLPLGYSYRFKVGFRWIGKRSKVIKHETLFTSACVQGSSGQSSDAHQTPPVALSET